MTKAERAAEMSRVRKLGVKRAKTKARPLRQNACMSEPATNDAARESGTESANAGSLHAVPTNIIPVVCVDAGNAGKLPEAGNAGTSRSPNGTRIDG